MTKFEIQRVVPPTSKQLEKGIFGSCNLQLVSDDGMPLLYLNNITIRKNSNTGAYFLAPPSQPYTTKDGTKKHMNFYSLLPLPKDETRHEEQKESLRALTATIVRHAENGGLHYEARESGSTTESASTSKPRSSKDPW